MLVHILEIVSLISGLSLLGLPFFAGIMMLRSKNPFGVQYILATVFGGVFCGMMLQLFGWEMVRFPPRYCINEAFMFHLERNGGLKAFYDWSQARMNNRAGVKKQFPAFADGQFFCLYDDYKGNMWLRFTRWDFHEPPHPLNLVCKLTGEKFTCPINPGHYTISSWNGDMRVAIEKGNRSNRTETEAETETDAPGIRLPLGVLLGFAIGTAWLFPLATMACRSRSARRFYGLWLTVFALCALSVCYVVKNWPELQRVYCAPETAVAALNAPKSASALRELMRRPTMIVEADPARTVINAPVLCGGDFFTVRFLCWDLGYLNYLYYCPENLAATKFFTDDAEVTVAAPCWWLVRYSGRAAGWNRRCFSLAGILGGCPLWLIMFVLSWRKRRRSLDEPPTSEASPAGKA